MKGCLKELLAAGTLLFCVLWGVGAGAVGGAALANHLPAGWPFGVVVALGWGFGLFIGVFVGFLGLDYLQQKFDYLSLTSPSDSQKGFAKSTTKKEAKAVQNSDEVVP